MVHQAGQERPPERELDRQCLIPLGDLTKQTEGIFFWRRTEICWQPHAPLGDI